MTAFVLAHPAYPPADTARHFASKLQFEVDSADVRRDLDAGANIVVIDTRSPELYAEGHVPGAINVPHRTMTAESTAFLRQYDLLITYCDGVGCNASTKGALRLAELGFPVKEMPGGIDWWIRDRHPVALGTESGSVKTSGKPECGC